MGRIQVLLLAAILPCRATAQTFVGSHDGRALQVDRVFATFSGTGAPGCAVGVYRNGRIVYARGYGMANLELGTTITPRTVFNIGSVSKMFTATAVVLLALDGRLSLDDPIDRYFPEMAPFAAGITVRQLLNHTSGLHEYFRVMRFAGISSNLGNADDFVRIITRATTTNFPPGSRIEYSNSAYVLAGALVARMSGQSLASFLKHRVFDPLGMAHTRLIDDHTLIIPGRAQGYEVHAGADLRIPVSEVNSGGDGGVWTTIEDLNRWDHNWMSGAVGGHALTDSLIVQNRLRDGVAAGAGLGGGLELYRGLHYYTKDGVDLGFTATYGHYVEAGLGVATLCNADVATDPLSRQVAAIYLRAQMAPESPPTPESWELSLLAASTVPVPAERLRVFEGWWRSDDLGILRAIRSSGAHLSFENGPELLPVATNRFRIAGNVAREVKFEPVTSGAPQQMLIHDRTGTRTFGRLDFVRLTPVQLDIYNGQYNSGEIETVYTLVPDSSGLVVRVGGRKFGRLVPTWADAFMLVNTGYDSSAILPLVPHAQNGDGRYVFEFTRDGGGKITGFMIQGVAGTGVRNLPFVRVQ